MQYDLRTKGSLISICANNTIGNISPKDMRDVLMSIKKLSASAKVSGGSVVTVAEGTPKLLVGFTNKTDEEGFNFDTESNIARGEYNEIVVENYGVYRIKVTSSFALSGNANIVYSLAINDLLTLHKMNTSEENIGILTIFTLLGGDRISIYIQSTTGDVDHYLENATFTVTKIS